MDKNRDRENLIEFIRDVESKFHPVDVFIFGSFLTNKYNDTSDIDIAFVFSDNSNTHDRAIQLMKISYKYNSKIEPHVFWKDNFINENPLAYQIFQTGIRASEFFMQYDYFCNSLKSLLYQDGLHFSGGIHINYI